MDILFRITIGTDQDSPHLWTQATHQMLDQGLALQQQQAFIDLARQIKTPSPSARQHNTANVLCAYHPPM
jgi:hypothetical protein